MPYPRVTALDTSSTVFWRPRSEALGISLGTRGTRESDSRLFELSRGEADIAVRTAQPNHPGWSPDPWHSAHRFVSGGRSDLVGSPSVDCAGECGRSSDQSSDDITPGILPSALRASLWLFKIAPDDFVEPLDFIARLVARVPKPRVNLTRFHAAR